jgi:hypothetical protein
LRFAIEKFISNGKLVKFLANQKGQQDQHRDQINDHGKVHQEIIAHNILTEQGLLHTRIEIDTGETETGEKGLGTETETGEKDLETETETGVEVLEIAKEDEKNRDGNEAEAEPSKPTCTRRNPNNLWRIRRRRRNPFGEKVLRPASKELGSLQCG